jgi:hypothetical protein
MLARLRKPNTTLLLIGDRPAHGDYWVCVLRDGQRVSFGTGEALAPGPLDWDGPPRPQAEVERRLRKWGDDARHNQPRPWDYTD